MDVGESGISLVSLINFHHQNLSSQQPYIKNFWFYHRSPSLSAKAGYGHWMFLFTPYYNYLGLFEAGAVRASTLSLKRNAPWPRVKVRWPWQGHIMYTCSREILKGGRILDQTLTCSLVFFSKRCISFGQECMVLNPGVFFNSAVFQVMLQKWFHIKISNGLEKPIKYRRPCQEKIAWYFVFHDFPKLTCTQTF